MRNATIAVVIAGGVMLSAVAPRTFAQQEDGSKGLIVIEDNSVCFGVDFGCGPSQTDPPSPPYSENVFFEERSFPLSGFGETDSWHGWGQIEWDLNYTLSSCCNGGSLCFDLECEALVCGVNPQCCSVSWDSACAETAIALCDCIPAFETYSFMVTGWSQEGHNTAHCTLDGVPNAGWLYGQGHGGFSMTLSLNDGYSYSSTLSGEVSGVFDGSGFFPSGSRTITANTRGNSDFSLNVVLSARCGDGIVDLPEKCDDQNDVHEDGCANDCRNRLHCPGGSGELMAPFDIPQSGLELRAHCYEGIRGFLVGSGWIAGCFLDTGDNHIEETADQRIAWGNTGFNPYGGEMVSLVFVFDPATQKLAIQANRTTSPDNHVTPDEIVDPPAIVVRNLSPFAEREGLESLVDQLLQDLAKPPLGPPAEPQPGVLHLLMLPGSDGGRMQETLYELLASIDCPWDLDGNGDVGINDFLFLLAAWGSSASGPPDFDSDGIVGITDFLELLANWGPCQ